MLLALDGKRLDEVIILIHVERFVDVAEGVHLWTEERGAGPPLLLVMGANASARSWPEALVDRLAERHRVIRYDHRDTGRSTRAFDAEPYAIPRLAEDAVAVLDAYGIDRAHVVGMSMGGILVQLLLLDHPDRLLTATLLATCALGSGLAGEDELPGPVPELLEYWAGMGAERSPEDEIAWRVEHWRLLGGTVLPFDAAFFRAQEAADIAHSGTASYPTAHARAEPSGLERGAELADVTVPTLVIETPEDPVNPPPNARHLAAQVASTLVTIPGMGHALSPAVLEPLADAILAHTH